MSESALMFWHDTVMYLPDMRKTGLCLLTQRSPEITYWLTHKQKAFENNTRVVKENRILSKKKRSFQNILRYNALTWSDGLMANSLKGKAPMQQCTDLLWHLKSTHVGSSGFAKSHFTEQSPQIQPKLCPGKHSRWLLYWYAMSLFGNFLCQLQSTFQSTFEDMLLHKTCLQKTNKQTNNEKLNQESYIWGISSMKFKVSWLDSWNVL